MVKQDMHGLYLFISDIRNCKSQEAEVKRIFRELANIRSQFNGSKMLDGYSKKKYLCKLLFIFLLGHDFEVGMLEAINLISSSKYSEKFIGYLFLSVIMNEKSNLMLLVHNAIKNDLISGNQVHENLALQYAANMANENMAYDISKDVIKILFDAETTDNVRQSAILCLLRIYRINPDVISNREYIERLVYFISHPNLGIVTAATSLLEALAEDNKLSGYPCVSNIVSKLHRIVKASPSDLQDYAYYFVPAPWLTVKLLKLLRNFSIPLDSVVRSRLLDCIELILNKCQEPFKLKKWEHRNSRNAVLFETMLLIHYIEVEAPLLLRACSILDMELKRKEYNLRYLALETMCLLSECKVAKERIKEQLQPIKESLYIEGDNCIRQKASDLLFVLCDKNNVEEIIQELFNLFLVSDDFTREESSLKIAILAEQFCGDPTWYVDVILELLQNFREPINQEIWIRLTQIVIKTDNMHSYATKRVYDVMRNASYNENLILVTGYILGEFGYLIAGDPASDSRQQLNSLHRHFGLCCRQTKSFLLTTYMKFANMFPDIKEDIKSIFKENSCHSDPDIQQRAVEYLKLTESPFLSFIMKEMPFSDKSKFSIQFALQKIRPGLSVTRVTKENCDYKEPILKRSISYNLLQDGMFVNGELVRRSATDITLSNASNSGVLKKSYTEILASIFNQPKSPVEPSEHKIPSFDVKNSDPTHNLIWQNEGILFDNQFLQVMTKGVFSKHKGRILLRYRNKAMHPFRNFLPTFLFQDAVKWKLQMKPCASIIFAGEEAEQEIEVECLQEFNQRPALSVGFDCVGSYCEFPLKLPITLNKFFESVMMDVKSFRERWANLSYAHQELMKILYAKHSMNSMVLIKKLNGMGMAVHPNLSQNTANIFGSGVFHCQKYKIGFLFRLQSNIELKRYRLTIRANRSTILEEIATLVEFLV